MKKKKYKPYGFDVEYEYKTYKYIGRDYGNSKSANKGWLLNLIRFCRKTKNKIKPSYTICHTYTQWTEHLKTALPTNILNYNDFIHWLHACKKILKNILMQ